ncbi:fungal-specific transcription factor domain-containing protein [Dipodascopsis uninucleata]
MPDGAGAWKMIKPPGSQIGRIAQACDRCRSKKIRCDGKRPSCTQCQNVGFECRTSDKLSRRAFPRGYTESLEDHIRQLENENRKLKEHIEKHDAELELLARVESVSPGRGRNSVSSDSDAKVLSDSSANSNSRKRLHMHKSRECSPARFSSLDSEMDENEAFTLRELQTLSLDGMVAGNSSGVVFNEEFREKVASTSPLLATLVADMATSVDLSTTGLSPLRPDTFSSLIPSLPSKVLAELLVNYFFKEWHSMFPVIHMPTFMDDFNQVYSAKSLLGREEFIVQLYLILSISARQISSSSESNTSYERSWKRLLFAIENRNTIGILQSFVLAQLYSCMTGQYSDMWQFKMRATGMALRLGLNRMQKPFNLSVKDTEIRLRLFWAVFTLDCFSSTLLGMPPIIREEDIECPYSSNVDSEFLTDNSILTPPPGSYTKVSASIALSKLSRVLYHILTAIYRPSTKRCMREYKLIFQLEDELEEWRRDLPVHLKFEMINGTPRIPSSSSSSLLHPRAPFLLLIYHYAKILIHRPAIATSDSKTKGTSSILAITDSAKNIIMLADYIKEKHLTWEPCFNIPKTLISCALVVLYSAIEYPKDGLLIQETKRIVTRCLDSIQNGSGVSLAEYQLLEKICSEILNFDLRSSSDSQMARHSAEAKAAVSQPLSIPYTTQLTATQEQAVINDGCASITIPHLPSSEQHSPAASSAARQDTDVLQWAIAQQYQLQYRSSISQVEVDSKEYVATNSPSAQDDTVLESLFAMMDSSGDGRKRRTERALCHSDASSSPSKSVLSVSSVSTVESSVPCKPRRSSNAMRRRGTEMNLGKWESNNVGTMSSLLDSPSVFSPESMPRGYSGDMMAKGVESGEWNAWIGDLLRGSEASVASAPPSISLDTEDTVASDINSVHNDDMKSRALPEVEFRNMDKLGDPMKTAAWSSHVEWVGTPVD